jgi:predicted outer membrane repeat protein
VFAQVYGGNAYCEVDILTTSFQLNSADNKGGAIYSGGDNSLGPCNVSVTKSSFFLNTAGFTGGAAHFEDETFGVIDESAFSTNCAASAGGAVGFLTARGLTIDRSNFDKNTAVERGNALFLVGVNGSSLSLPSEAPLGRKYQGPFTATRAWTQRHTQLVALLPRLLEEHVFEVDPDDGSQWERETLPRAGSVVKVSRASPVEAGTVCETLLAWARTTVARPPPTPGELLATSDPTSPAYLASHDLWPGEGSSATGSALTFADRFGVGEAEAEALLATEVLFGAADPPDINDPAAWGVGFAREMRARQRVSAGRVAQAWKRLPPPRTSVSRAALALKSAAVGLDPTYSHVVLNSSVFTNHSAAFQGGVASCEGQAVVMCLE